MKKALKYLISVIIAIIVAGFFIYLLIPALTGFMTLVGIVVVIASTQTAVKNSLKEVLQRFDTAYGKERRIEADLGGFAIVLFGDRTEVSEQEKNVLKYFKLNADEYEYEEIYKQKEPECTVEVTFRLYLCSSDYAVQVVRVVKKENENG